MTPVRFKPSVTVAAVIEHALRPDCFLLVEEHTPEGLRLNNPAGHLEQGETPQQAVLREVLEETACHFEPEAFLGTYLARFVRQRGDQAAPEDITYVRLAYCGRVGEAEAGRALDEGIVRTVWMPATEIQAQATRLRSPLVWQCINDYRQGRRLPLSAVVAHESLSLPLHF